MSMAIRRASYTGDPGLWDVFKGAVGGAWKGLTGGGGRQPPIPVKGPGMYSFPPLQDPGNGGVKPPWQVDWGAAFPGGKPFISRGVNGNGGAPCDTAGYHLNKSAYFLMSGEFVPEGSRYVRNRKRNPANARATSRAISRVVGAKRYATSLSRISIRKKC